MKLPSFGRTFACAAGLCLAAAGVPVVAAGGPPRAAAPVCAFLDPERVPRAALLEAKLLADPSATWVERTAIDKILKEQTLQAAFGPQGGSDRVRLGKLLKADLLVLVRSAKGAKEPALEVVMSDTARGLRLTVRAVAVTASADADVAALTEVVRAGLKKFREAIREVVAVPPFASTNLMYEYEHLKGAYAKLVEQAALASPGVVVVELAEAEAIAREIRLADPGATVKRSPPLYLLGEFRHQGRGADTRIALTLRATRGGQPAGKAVARTVAPPDAPAVLHQWVGDRLAAGKGKPTPTLDAKVEAKQLGELSRSRQRVGDWADALALLEASLLLDPNQPELHADGMAVIRVVMERMLPHGKKEIDLLRRAVPLQRRGFEHMEALVTSRARLPRFVGPDVRGGRMFFSPFPGTSHPPPNFPLTLPRDPPEVQELVKEVERERRALCLRLLPLVVKDGDWHEIVTFINLALWDLPLAERYAERARLVLQYQDSPAMTRAANAFIYLSPHTLELKDLPVYHKLLDRLEKEGNAVLRVEVGKARQRLPGVEKDMKQLAARAAEQRRLAEEATGKLPANVPDWGRLKQAEKLARLDKHLANGPLRPLRLTTVPPEDEWFLDHLGGVVAAGPGIDVFWAWGAFPRPRSKDPPGRPRPAFGTGQSGPVLFVMKEKGQLRRVWEKPGVSDRFTAVCFDGRYVWAATEGVRLASALFVLDPVAEKVYEVTAADGLPQPPESLVKDTRRVESLGLRLAPLGPGRVCVAGGFGRGWVGVAAIDRAPGKVAVDVIHEARELSNQADKTARFNPRLAFTPVYMHVLRGQPGAEGKAGLRVLVGRKPMLSEGRGTGNVDEVTAHPLVVDPDGRAVEVMKAPIYAWKGWGLTGGPEGAARLVQWTPRTQGLRLLRIDYPATVRDLGELVIPRSDPDVLTEIVGKQLHIAVGNGPPAVQPGGGRAGGSSWWTADLDGKNLRKVADGLPPVQTMARSSHYGLVVRIGVVPGLAMCAVEIGRVTP